MKRGRSQGIPGSSQFSIETVMRTEPWGFHVYDHPEMALTSESRPSTGTCVCVCVWGGMDLWFFLAPETKHTAGGGVTHSSASRCWKWPALGQAKGSLLSRLWIPSSRRGATGGSEFPGGKWSPGNLPPHPSHSASWYFLGSQSWLRAPRSGLQAWVCGFSINGEQTM